MQLKKFILGLGLCVMINLVAFVIYAQFVRYDGMVYFEFYVLSFFVLVSILFYGLGKHTSQSSDLYRFNRLIVFSTAFKLIASILLILSLKYHLALDRPVQIIPFLISYLVFTSYEVYYLSTLGQKSFKKTK